MSELKQFQKIDFLTYKSFVGLIENANQPHEYAKILTKQLKNYICVDDAYVYIICKNKTYKKYDLEKKGENQILMMSTLLLNDSYKAMNEGEIELLTLKYKNARKCLSNHSVVINIKQITHYLYVDTKFDCEHTNIHFNNGFINTETGQFKMRRLHHNYITHYIKRDYVPSSQNKRKKLLKIIKQIYPDEGDRNAILMALGSSLSGKTIQDQEMLFLLGLGSTGKSFLLSLMEVTFECYIKQLGSKTFELGNHEVNKVINTFCANPQIRLIWINELSDVRMDGNLFKKFCEGKYQTVKLYKEEQHDVYHYAKIVTTANQMPNIPQDSGTKRRTVAAEHHSEFTKDDNKVNNNKNIYKAIDDLHNKLKDKGYCNAFVDILIKRAVRYSTWGERMELTNNFQVTKEGLVSANDVYQDFIDGNLIKTSNPNDKVSKGQMYEMFKLRYPKKCATDSQIMTSLKERGIKYDCQARKNNIKGVYMQVKINDFAETGTTPVTIKCKEDYDLEIKSLKKLLKVREEEIENQRKELNKMKVHNQSSVNVDLVDEIKVAPEEQSIETVCDSDCDSDSDSDSDSESDSESDFHEEETAIEKPCKKKQSNETQKKQPNGTQKLQAYVKQLQSQNKKQRKGGKSIDDIFDDIFDEF